MTKITIDTAVLDQLVETEARFARAEIVDKLKNRKEVKAKKPAKTKDKDGFIVSVKKRK